MVASLSSSPPELPLIEQVVAYTTLPVRSAGSATKEVTFDVSDAVVGKEWRIALRAVVEEGGENAVQLLQHWTRYVNNKADQVLLSKVALQMGLLINDLLKNKDEAQITDKDIDDLVSGKHPRNTVAHNTERKGECYPLWEEEKMEVDDEEECK